MPSTAVTSSGRRVLVWCGLSVALRCKRRSELTSILFALKGEETVQVGGRGVADHGAIARGQHGGHELRFEGEDRVAGGVDASVDAVQAPGLRAICDRVLAEADRSQLLERDDAVLPPCERRDPGVRRWCGV
jgi:hypothetical protein